MNIEKPQAVLFDLDGTLLDTAPTFVKQLNILLVRHGKKPLPAEIIREQVLA
jgi:N-acetyl-D-muramate 6-phosphate phosphatase